MVDLFFFSYRSTWEQDMLAYIQFFLLAIEMTRGHTLSLHAQIVNRGALLNASYDFIIIGGGTSGLTVANRLTENPNSKAHSMSTKNQKKLMYSWEQLRY